MGAVAAAAGAGVKASVDSAIAEAIAVIDIVFMVGLQKKIDAPTDQMVSETSECDYIKIHIGQLIFKKDQPRVIAKKIKAVFNGS
jgi:hypothetical protein